MRRGDPAFAAELEGARRRRGWMRRLAFDEAKAEAFLKRVRAGERIRDLLDKPGMPSRRTYTYWRRTQVAFQAALWKLREEITDRIVLGGSLRSVARSPDMPCARTLYAWAARER